MAEPLTPHRPAMRRSAVAAALAGLAPPAARGARHAVPARRHRAGPCCRTLSHLPLWCDRADARWCCCGAAASRWRSAAAAGPLVCWSPCSRSRSACTSGPYRTLLGKEPGVTLLVVLMALKTLELRARRDAFVVFFLGFFIDPHALPLFAVAARPRWRCWSSVLGPADRAGARAHAGRQAERCAQAGGLAARTALLGAPVMALLFLLFPRIGPLWGMPQDGIVAHRPVEHHAAWARWPRWRSDDSIAMRAALRRPARRRRARCTSAARC